MYCEEMSITQECFVLKQSRGGTFIFSDSFTLAYGAGETPEEAIADYLECCDDYADDKDYDWHVPPSAENALLTNSHSGLKISIGPWEDSEVTAEKTCIGWGIWWRPKDSEL